MFLSAVAVLILALTPVVDPSPPQPVLSAQQYLQAEDIYRKVVDQCCLRKEAARKVHLEIEQMVAAGQSEAKIVAVLLERIRREPLRAPEARPSGPGPVVLAVLAGAILVASWFIVRGDGSRLS